jgi:hypothetical protein
MQKRSPVRKHLTPVQRKELLADYRRSGLTQRTFAIQAGVGVSTLQLWLRQENCPWPTPARSPKFVPVPNLLASVLPPAVYRLRLVGGAVLEIGSDYKREQLEALLQILNVL